MGRGAPEKYAAASPTRETSRVKGSQLEKSTVFSRGSELLTKGPYSGQVEDNPSGKPLPTSDSCRELGPQPTLARVGTWRPLKRQRHSRRPQGRP